MKNRAYVAPCLPKPPVSNVVTGFLVCGGLIVTLGGVGTAEKASLTTGVVVAVIGLVLMYFGTRRLALF